MPVKMRAVDEATVSTSGKDNIREAAHKRGVLTTWDADSPLRFITCQDWRFDFSCSEVGLTLSISGGYSQHARLAKAIR